MADGLSREEVARAKFTFSIYDFEGCDKIDAMQLGNALRALGLCPSLKRISNLGGTIQRGEKMLSVEEFLAIYQDAKKDKVEGGTLEDYMEALSSHDKDRSGKISIKTLGHLLHSYGEEKLDRLEVEEVIADCGQPDEDDDQIDYKFFLQNLMKGPEIKIPMAMLRATEDGDDSGMDEA